MNQILFLYEDHPSLLYLSIYLSIYLSLIKTIHQASILFFPKYFLMVSSTTKRFITYITFSLLPDLAPTKHLCILVPAPFFLYLVPYLHQFSTVEYISVDIALF